MIEIPDELIKLIVDDVLNTLEWFEEYSPVYNEKDMEEFDHEYEIKAMLQDTGIVTTAIKLPRLSDEEIELRNIIDKSVKQVIDKYNIHN